MERLHDQRGRPMMQSEPTNSIKAIVWNGKKVKRMNGIRTEWQRKHTMQSRLASNEISDLNFSNKLFFYRYHTKVRTQIMRNIDIKRKKKYLYSLMADDESGCDKIGDKSERFPLVHPREYWNVWP